MSGQPPLAGVAHRDEGEREHRARLVERDPAQPQVDALPADVRRSLKYAELFDRMQRGEAMTMLPFELEIK